MASVRLVTEMDGNARYLSLGCQRQFPWIKPLPNDKILDQSNLKDLADDQINVTYVTIFFLERVENIVGKGENAGY